MAEQITGEVLSRENKIPNGLPARKRVEKLDYPPIIVQAIYPQTLGRGRQSVGRLTARQTIYLNHTGKHIQNSAPYKRKRIG